MKSLVFSFSIFLFFSIPFIGAGDVLLDGILQDEIGGIFGIARPDNLETLTQVKLDRDNKEMFEWLSNGAIGNPPVVGVLPNFIAVAHWIYCIDTKKTCDVATFIKDPLSRHVESGTQTDSKYQNVYLNTTAIPLDDAIGKGLLKLPEIASFGNSISYKFLEKYKSILDQYKINIKIAGMKGRIFNGTLLDTNTYILGSIYLGQESKQGSAFPL